MKKHPNASAGSLECIARLALVCTLLVHSLLWAGKTWAQSASSRDRLFEGVNKIELFLARPTDIRNLQASKVPVKVYRMYAHMQYIQETLMPRIPKLPASASNAEIQRNISAYMEAHRAQIEAESADLKAMYLEGKELSFRYKLMEYPSFVINGVAVFDHTNDLHVALRAYQKYWR